MTLWDKLQKIPREDWPNFLKKNYPEVWRECAWEKVNQWRNNQREQAEILGEIPNFEKLLFTLDPQANKMVNYAFIRYWMDDLIYKDSYLINWSVALQTALSDVPEDIGRVEREDPLISFYYYLEKIDIQNSKLNYKTLEILEKLLARLKVATVRPETIFADIALAIHPQKLQAILLEKLDLTEIENVLSEIQNKTLSLYFKLDFSSKQTSDYNQPLIVKVRLILEEQVDLNFGTGCLKITPAHDLIDYEIAKKHQFDNFQQAINRNGKLTDICGHFAHLSVEQARVLVIAELLENGHIPLKTEFEANKTKIYQELQTNLKQLNFRQNWVENSFNYYKALAKLQELAAEYFEIDWKYKHSVVICERSKTVVEPLISEEFFVNYYQEFRHRPINNLTNRFVYFLDPQIDRQNIDQTFTRAVAIILLKNLHQLTDQLVVYRRVDIKESKYYFPGGRVENDENYLDTAIREVEEELGLTGLEYLSSVGQTVSTFTNKGENQEVKEVFYLFSLDWECWEKRKANEPGIEVYLKDWQEVYQQTWPQNQWVLRQIFELEFPEFFEKIDKQTETSLINLDQERERKNKDEQEMFTQAESKSLIKKSSFFNENQTLQKLALDGFKQVRFLPKEYQERAENYFANIRNWCISRDLIWGHNIPVWYNLDLNPRRKFFKYSQMDQVFDLENIEHLNYLTGNASIDLCKIKEKYSKTHFTVREFFAVQVAKPSTLGHWVREEKILDTWFSSTLWPLSTLNYPQFLTKQINQDLAMLQTLEQDLQVYLDQV